MMNVKNKLCETFIFKNHSSIPNLTDTSFVITGTRQPEDQESGRRSRPSGAGPEPLQNRLWLSSSAQCCSRAISQLIHFINSDLILADYQVYVTVCTKRVYLRNLRAFNHEEPLSDELKMQ